MSKFSTFNELKSKRKEMVKSMKENDAFDGIKNLLTELYPDKAHFILELLQNAEDMNATEVNFVLYKDRLIFTHNGNKRAFTLADVEAITNISKGTKKDDPTTIGQFGVGFKAVYAYTDTPEIYSEKHSFKIVDMLIPEDEDITQQELNGQTKFVFPFNNADKPEEKAVEEITVGLCSLDETAILFLNHINTINYTLSDGRRGYIKVDDSVSSVKFIKSILVKKVDNNEVVSYWGKFNGQCPIVVNGKVKDNTVSIAYRMKRDDAGKFSIDSNLIGKVCIFFPTDQKSDLRFHINAPFASTVARDNIRYCDENDKLIEALANLCVESLYYFRGVKILDYSVYDALPTIVDFNNPNSRYKIFAEKIKTEFESEELFISEQGDYKNSNDVMLASMDIKTVLPSLEVERYYQKSWLPRFTTSRTRLFIGQFKIEEFTIEDFIDSLEKDPHFFDTLFSEQNTQYFKTLYALFAQSKEREYTNYTFVTQKKLTRNEILSNVAFILCEDKKVHGVEDNLFLRTDYQPKHYLNNPIYIDISLKDTTQDSNIKRFLLSIGVKEMSESVDTEAGLSNDTDRDSGVWLKILEQFRNNPESILQYKNRNIFLARKINDDKDKICRVCATDCCWSKEVAFFYDDKYIFAEDCYNDIKQYLSNIKEVFVKLGGKVTPKIIRSYLSDDYPMFSFLKRERERCNTCVRKDFIIDGFKWSKLKNIRVDNLFDVALLLWNLVLKYNNKNILHIVYKANARANEQNNLESSIVYYLKRMPWIPTKSGTYKCPYELTDDDLLKEFKYETPSILLEAISKRPSDRVEQLKNNGIEDENVLEFAEFDSDVQDKILAFGKQLQAKKHKTGKSLTELAATSDREQYPEEDNDDNFGGFHKPKNIDKRKLKLEKEFDDREELQTSIKKLRFVLEKPATEEKIFVKNEYHSHCQICGKEGILTAKGKRYFEAINIFSTSKLDEKLQLNLGLGWNTLCLCPNCAAKFKYSQLTISSLIVQAQSININAAQSAFFDISISLEGTPTTIRFTPKHLLALQVAIKKIKEIESSDD